MSATDYMTSAVMWLPWVALAFAAGTVIHFAMRRAEGFRPEHEIRATYSTPFRAWIAMDLPYTLLYFLLVALGLFNFLFGNPFIFFFIPFALAATWFFLCNWYFHHNALRPISRLVFALIFFGPPFTLVAFWNGLSDGYRALSQVENVYRLKLENDDAEKSLQLLRILDRGLLFRDPISSKVVFYNWDNVSAFSLNTQAPAKETADKVIAPAANLL